MAIVKLDMLATHLLECEHNPKKPVHCTEGCGLVIPKDELKVGIVDRLVDWVAGGRCCCWRRCE